MPFATRVPAAAPPPPGPRGAGLHLLPAAAAALAATAALLGGLPAALAGVALAAAAGWWLRPAAADAGAAQLETGARQLQQQVLPVWRRHIDSARSHAERSTAELAERFASLSAQLELALSAQASLPQMEGGAVDEMMERLQPQLQTLLAVHRAALAEREAMLQAMTEHGRQLAELATLAQEVQSIGRATHLLALNASVEATRAGAAGGGFAVVAQEVRELAGQSRQAGTRLARLLAAMRERIEGLAGAARGQAIDGPELELRADEAGREVLRALIGRLADVTRGNRTLREAGAQVRNDIDDILVALQSQDRTHQMLGSVTEDLARMSSWLQGAEDEAAMHPAQWLQRLEASYTMEEMRSSHHDTVAVERQSGVEFF